MSGWIGVDLDGTLAEYAGWGKNNSLIEGIGEPVPAMVDRVKAWLAAGRDVRIFTARVYPDGRKEALDPVAVTEKIQNWCELYIGQKLPVTCAKDFRMVELWDDRCVRVEMNTGRILSSEAANG